MKISELTSNPVTQQGLQGTRIPRPKTAPTLANAINGFDLYIQMADDGSLECLLYDAKRLVAYIRSVEAVGPLSGWWDIESAVVKKSYQGKQLGLAFYKLLITKSNLSFGSFDQSVGAKKVWAKLAQDPAISVWILDFGNYQSERPIITDGILSRDDGDLYTNSGLILIATRPNTTLDKKLQARASKHEKQ